MHMDKTYSIISSVRQDLPTLTQGFFPYSVMHVEYVYHGQVLESCSGRILSPRIEHVRVAARSYVLSL